MIVSHLAYSFPIFNRFSSNEYLLRVYYVSGVGGWTMGRIWWRWESLVGTEDLVWASQSGRSALGNGSSSSSLAAKSCLCEPLFSFVHWDWSYVTNRVVMMFKWHSVPTLMVSREVWSLKGGCFLPETPWFPGASRRLEQFNGWFSWVEGSPE